MTALWLFMFLASTAFAPLRVYEGTWTITASKTMAGSGKSDTLVNRCNEGAAFYTCEQIVNGTTLALIVFTATSDPNKFHTQPVLPNGSALPGSELTINGNRWTFLNTVAGTNGQTRYRIENTFTGRDKIHFEQYQSIDGTTWVKINEGDDVRVQ